MNASSARQALRAAVRAGSSAELAASQRSNVARRNISTLMRAGASSSLAAAPRRQQAQLPSQQQKRSYRMLKFGEEEEKVYERNDWPVDKLQEYFKNDTFCVLGYGSQGYAQSLK